MASDPRNPRPAESLEQIRARRLAENKVLMEHGPELRARDYRDGGALGYIGGVVRRGLQQEGIAKAENSPSIAQNTFLHGQKYAEAARANAYADSEFVGGPPAQYAPSAQMQGVESGMSSYRNRTPEERNAELATHGLTRIVKTGPHSYSNLPDAEGSDVRLYNAEGNRADVSYQPGQGAVAGRAYQRGPVAPNDPYGMPGIADAGDPVVAAEYARSNASREDNRAAGYGERVNARGDASLARVQRTNSEGEARIAAQQNAEFEAALSPQDRAARQAAIAKSRGENERATLDRNSRELIAGAGLQATQIEHKDATTAKEKAAQDQLWAKDPATAVALARTQIQGLSDAQLDEYIKTDAGKQLISHVNDVLHLDTGVGGGSNRLGNLKKGIFSDYTTRDAPLFGPGTSGDAEMGGLRPEQFAALNDAETRRIAQSLRTTTRQKGK